MSELSSLLLGRAHQLGVHGAWQTLAADVELAATGWDAFDDVSHQAATRLARLQSEAAALIAVMNDCDSQLAHLALGRETAAHWGVFCARLQAFAAREGDSAYIQTLLAHATQLREAIAQGRVNRPLDDAPAGPSRTTLRGISSACRRLYAEVTQGYLDLLVDRIDLLGNSGQMRPADMWFVVLGGMEAGGQSPMQTGADSLTAWVGAVRPLGAAQLEALSRIGADLKHLRAQCGNAPEISADAAGAIALTPPRVEALVLPGAGDMSAWTLGQREPKPKRRRSRRRGQE